MTVLNQYNQYQLHWETSSEIKTDYFDVETSQYGTNFTRTGTLATKGTNINGHKYEYSLPQPTSGLGFYFVRLKIVDSDGQTEYSNVTIVGSRNDDKYLNPAIYPVPTKEHIRVSLPNKRTAPYCIKDITGNKLLEGQCKNGQSIYIGDMHPGVYFASFYEKKQTSIVTFTVE